jgi:mannose-6-phosphate isomerase-like protein (cupin superfamily)
MPLSRESLPKQFAPLVGPVSTFRQLVSRVSDRTVFAEPIIITNSDFRFIVAEELRACGVHGQVVLEPVRRDSGPAVTTASELVPRRDKASLMLVVASDHVVPKPEEFVAACREASAAAAGSLPSVFLLVPRQRVTAIFDHHRRVLRPWGYYQAIDAGSRYQVKRIVVEPSGKLSLQKHLHRAEYWVVVRGTAEVTVGDEARTIHENESIYLPIGSVHRLANPIRACCAAPETRIRSHPCKIPRQRNSASTSSATISGVRSTVSTRSSACSGGS